MSTRDIVNPKNQIGGTKRRVLTVLATAFMILFCGLILFPLIAGLAASFRPGRELVRKGLAIDLNIATMTLDNYKYLFSGNADSKMYFMWYRNSLYVTTLSVVFTLLLCYIIAYAFSMYRFKGKNFFFFLVIATMMVPFEILMFPLYQQTIKMGLMDTTAGVLLPGLCKSATIFFFRQYMQGLPKELLDAGRIDGCTEYGICFKIMMPLTKPAFASMAILSAMGAWNDMLWPLLVYRTSTKFTLTIGLNTLLSPYGNNYDVLIAGSMFAVLPILLVYLCFQRYFIDGLTSGSVKG